jgi:hypothetical protein
LPLSSSQRKSLERFLEYPLAPAGEAYLASRGLLEAATALRFGSVPDSPERRDHWMFRGRLVIPSFSARGTVTDLAMRCIKDHVCDQTVLWVDDEGKEHYCPKYLFVKGLEKRLYHVESVATNEPEIHLCEGQLDAASLVACGLPAVGVPGSQAWKPHAPRLFQGFDRVLFWADQDDKGASMTLFEKIRHGIRGLELVTLPSGYDVNSYFVEHGPAGIHALVGAESNTGSTEDDTEENDGIEAEWDDAEFPPPPF